MISPILWQNKQYGNKFLLLWKKSEVRDLPENKECKEKAEKILYECASVFPENK